MHSLQWTMLAMQKQTFAHMSTYFAWSQSKIEEMILLQWCNWVYRLSCHRKKGTKCHDSKNSSQEETFKWEKDNRKKNAHRSLIHPDCNAGGLCNTAAKRPTAIFGSQNVSKVSSSKIRVGTTGLRFCMIHLPSLSSGQDTKGVRLRLILSSFFRRATASCVKRPLA